MDWVGQRDEKTEGDPRILGKKLPGRSKNDRCSLGRGERKKPVGRGYIGGDVLPNQRCEQVGKLTAE